MLENLNKLIKEVFQIDIKTPGLLEIPKDKKFWELSTSHYEDLVNRKGYQKIIRGLTNIETWNKDSNPEISQKASRIADKLRDKFRSESK